MTLSEAWYVVSQSLEGNCLVELWAAVLRGHATKPLTGMSERSARQPCEDFLGDRHRCRFGHEGNARKATRLGQTFVDEVLLLRGL